ncbi:MAG: ASPIC/UnbV domain-containing protein [Planctomycetes bacterium]|nr:ASPIC/UnbV domain-containing protein [Planctomycetota bacterium]
MASQSTAGPSARPGAPRKAANQDAGKPSSQPTSQPGRDPTAGDRLTDYLAGWLAMTDLMHQGKSWSGRERNCCYLNLGAAGRPDFVDVSAVTGLDFLDDGRSVAVTDWDGDGDLDLWFKNRTGPQLRLMVNPGSPGTHFIAFKLQGTTCNRDAIGATATVHLAGRSLVRTVRAGEGYLSQSSKWLHFGLGQADRIERVVVRWPGGGVDEYARPAVDARYRIVQGASQMHLVPPRALQLESRTADPEPAETPLRLVLKEPLPLPPSLIEAFADPESHPRAQLVTLWAHWCSPCLVELAELADTYGRLTDVGVGLLAWNVDVPSDRIKARALFDERIAPRLAERPFPEKAASPESLDVLAAVFEHVRHQSAEQLPLPSSLLIDGNGLLQIIYLGPLSMDTVVADARDYALSTRPAHRRSSFEGRWYFRTPRHLGGLARLLKERGRSAEAAFYRELAQDREQQRQSRDPR